ncbi:conserved Plasmodium protein, unknown function [Plasmodium gallinaceum]|uniref:C2H2-type domain-containing protein n=1 Tax=Plasmodium gallinaceum TaxID=5849 RepID=A0A1J1GTZ2_PLAGA|nr:conserved Plasmodium protein, unknown function [Plasmodium gallinaceum]CRG94782.1 conserved Plasmodium protein, unknown function [Plasmodium gallinaceum]
MNEDILTKYVSYNTINNTPYNNYFYGKKRNKMKSEDDPENDHINKRAKLSLYENFELIKKKKLNENDICIDHFKDMEKYIEKMQELRSIYNYLFDDNLSNSHDILCVNRKFCSIEFNDIIDKNIFFEDSSEGCNISNCEKLYVNNSNVLIKKKKKEENNKNISENIKENSILVNNMDKKKQYIQLKGDDIKIIGKKFLNSVSNQLLYIDDLSMYDVLLLLSFVIQLQNEQKNNEKEERNLEIIANIDEFQTNSYSLKEIYKYYYKERNFQCFTCGLRFYTSLEKLNHIENHYKKNKNYMNSSEKSSIIKNKKNCIYLEHVNLSIEFFICKNYSFLEDLYDNVVTKNSNFINFQNSFDYNIKNNFDNNNNNSNNPMNVKNYPNLNNQINLSSEVNFKNEQDYSNTGINFNNQLNLNDKTKIISNNNNDEHNKSISFYISNENISNEENNIGINDKNIENIFDFTRKCNEIDSFYCSNRTVLEKNVKERNKTYFENDIKNTSDNNNQINCFDFIYGNQNTYDVYLSKYYTITEDNNVLINYIDGVTMYKNIMKCLEIKDILNYDFPSWIPKRSLNNFLIKRITEMNENTGNQKIFNNILTNKSTNNFSKNNNTDENKYRENLDMQNNIWQICTSNDFYISKNLSPINTFLSATKVYSKESDDKTNFAYHKVDEINLNNMTKFYKIFQGNNNNPNEKKCIFNSDEGNFTNKHALKLQQINIKECKENNVVKSENFFSDSRFQIDIINSFLNIFNEKYFLQNNVFKHIFLFYLRKSYFLMLKNFKSNTEFNEIQNRLFNYIYDNYTQKTSIFDINNYHNNECLLCKEVFSFDYSYEYNDFYYVDVISVDLNNIFEDEEEDNYDFNLSTDKINEACECIYNENGYDIINNKLNNMDIFLDTKESLKEENIKECTLSELHSNRKNETIYKSINIDDFLEDIKNIISENCFLRKSNIESSLDYNYQIKNLKKKKKKDDFIYYYNNLFKSFCIPYETLDILHKLQKTNIEKNKIGNQLKNFDVKKEFIDEEINAFIKNFENVINDITDDILENSYKNRSRASSFREVIKNYIYNDNKNKNIYNNFYFPSKNYIHTNFTYFHTQCFKSYIEFYILPYYFIRKLNDKKFKEIIISTIKSFFNAYQNACKFINKEKESNSHKLKKQNVKKEKIKKRKHF